MPIIKSSLGEGTQSVLLTVAILERIARENGPLRISEIAREIDTSKSRVFRHLQTLASCEFVVHDEATGGYDVGSLLLEICRTINSRHDLLSIALPVLDELKHQTGHTAIVSRVDPVGVHVLTSLSSSSPIVIEVRAGTVLPFERSAQGLVALAFAPPTRLNGRSPLTQARQTFELEHPQELERIADQGWAKSQMRQGLMGKAAPVLGRGGNLVATIALLDTVSAMEGCDKEDTRHLLAAAKKLEDELAAATTNGAA